MTEERKVMNLPYYDNIKIASASGPIMVKDGIKRVGDLISTCGTQGQFQRALEEEKTPIPCCTEITAALYALLEMSDANDYKRVHQLAVDERAKEGMFRPNMFKIQLCMTDASKCPARFLASSQPRVAGTLLAVAHDPSNMFHSAWLLLCRNQSWDNGMSTVFHQLPTKFEAEPIDVVAAKIGHAINKIIPPDEVNRDACFTSYYEGSKLRALDEIADDVLEQLEEQQREEDDAVNTQERELVIEDRCVEEQPQRSVPMGPTKLLFEGEDQT